MWAILGDIEFDVIGSPSGWEERWAAGFAEHARISAKSLLEAVGGTLDEISWNIRLHHELHDVTTRLRQIRDAITAREPVALVLGDGNYLGPWVIAAGTVTARKNAPTGGLISADLSITLREYAGEFTRPTPAPGLLSALTQPGMLTQPIQTPTWAQQIAGATRTAQNAIRAGLEIARDVKALIDNPALIIARIPDIVGAVNLGQEAAEVMQTAGALVQDASEIVTVGMGVWSDMQSVRAALAPPRLETIGDQLTLATGRLDRSMQRLNNARGPVLRITSAVAVRKR